MTLIHDPIVEELRAHRKAFAQAHGDDLLQITEVLRLREGLLICLGYGLRRSFAEMATSREAATTG